MTTEFCLGMAVARDLPDTIRKRKSYKRSASSKENYEAWKNADWEEYEDRPFRSECEVYSFPQSWSSTALGFGGIGGQAFTTAQTTVVIHNENAAVYFGDRLAYVIKKFNRKLLEDMSLFQMADVAESGKYHGEG